MNWNDWALDESGWYRLLTILHTALNEYDCQLKRVMFGEHIVCIRLLLPQSVSMPFCSTCIGLPDTILSCHIYWFCYFSQWASSIQALPWNNSLSYKSHSVFVSHQGALCFQFNIQPASILFFLVPFSHQIFSPLIYL